MGIRFVNESVARRLEKHRVHQWMDTNTLEPKFGVQTKVGERIWAHVTRDSSPILFNAREDAQALAKELSA